MTRPLRIEFPGAFYHVMARGNRGHSIYADDADRRTFIKLVGAVCARFGWAIHAWCLMTNHYHLLVETPLANLSRGMRHLNGVFTQRTNRRHGHVGHLFQGRYKAIVVQKDAYLIELSRYIVLNPVRAKLVLHPAAWPWSSYRATAGIERTPDWLHSDVLLSCFSHRSHQAERAWIDFVAQGSGVEVPWLEVRCQLYLGDDAFESEVRNRSASKPHEETTRAQRRAFEWPLSTYQCHYSDHREAMARAYLSGAYTMAQIADHFGVHYRTVSRAVRQFEKHGDASGRR